MSQPSPTCLPQGNAAFATSLAMLLLRLALGAVFIYHGSQLCFGAFDGPGVAKFAQMMEEKHLPLLPATAWAYMAAYGEFLGGCGVFLGLLARLATLPLIVTMLVAIATVHAKNGFSMQNGGYEYNVVLIAIAAAILLVGPGLVSVDAFLFPKGLWACGPQPRGDPQKGSASNN